VRFASVYKNFREARDFEELLGHLAAGAAQAAAAEEAPPVEEAPPARRPRTRAS